MAATDRVHGKNGQVKVDLTGGATAIPVASLNSWSASFATDKVDVSCFGDPNKVYVVGLADVKGSVAGFWDKTDRTLFEAALGSVAVALELVPNVLDPTYFFSGPAWLDASIEVSADGAVSVSGEWVAAGAWDMAPAPTLAMAA